MEAKDGRAMIQLVSKNLSDDWSVLNRQMAGSGCVGIVVRPTMPHLPVH